MPCLPAPYACPAPGQYPDADGPPAPDQYPGADWSSVHADSADDHVAADDWSPAAAGAVAVAFVRVPHASAAPDARADPHVRVHSIADSDDDPVADDGSAATTSANDTADDTAGHPDPDEHLPGDASGVVVSAGSGDGPAG